MKEISIEKFEKAKAFLNTEARELELARFRFTFENGSKEDVLLALKSYQNEDGGFGNGIEPDFWLPLSSPMATWTAGQILMEIDADKNEPIVRSMLSYLMNTYNENGMWDTVLPDNNDYPHAPWWHWQEGVQENWMFNPGVELAAFLVHWAIDSGEEAIGWDSIQKAVNYLMNKEEMDKHEINNFQQLIKIIKPYETIFDAKCQYSLSEVTDKVLNLAKDCVNKNPSTWTEGYKPVPLDFIDGPEHPLCGRLGTLVVENLIFYLKQANEEGIWDIPWSWGSYPNEFEIARTYWKGILAVNRYKQLKQFGYLD